MITVKLTNDDVSSIIQGLEWSLDDNYPSSEPINKSIIKTIHKVQKAAGLPLEDYNWEGGE